MTTQRIYRYQLYITDEPTVDMPAGARVLSVAPERHLASPRKYNAVERVDLWAVVDPTARTEQRAFRIVGTGNPVPADCGDYIGTVPTHDGALIWHVFEASR